MGCGNPTQFGIERGADQLPTGGKFELQKQNGLPCCGPNCLSRWQTRFTASDPEKFKPTLSNKVLGFIATLAPIKAPEKISTDATAPKESKATWIDHFEKIANTAILRNLSQEEKDLYENLFVLWDLLRSHQNTMATNAVCNLYTLKF